MPLHLLDEFGNHVAYQNINSIILNGVPGMKITCKRRVTQGDPVSLLLCVLAIELLQIVINEAWHDDETKLPIDECFALGY